MDDTISKITAPLSETDIDDLEFIELLFFAYRDFVSDPDLILSQYGFGRAHHRALYFVNRQPGLTVAELLEILQITKQSLARVLRQLIETGHILQNEGENDRRKRLLFPTKKGRELVLTLSDPQSRRFKSALKNLTGEDSEKIKSFLNSIRNRP